MKQTISRHDSYPPNLLNENNGSRNYEMPDFDANDSAFVRLAAAILDEPEEVILAGLLASRGNSPHAFAERKSA